MNRLQNEISPYLRDHADDPVHWHPWDKEAFALAKRKNVPILLSIGYAASSLCHKMDRESFQNHNVAKTMNKNFVCIKVDREERPDLDQIYQSTYQMLNRKPGGWPLTLFLDPKDHLPIYAGGYFPPQQTRSTPSFREALTGIAKMYGKQDDKVQEFKSKLKEALAGPPDEIEAVAFDAALIERACAQIDSSFDEKYGGFSEAPKFPHPPGLEFMMDAIAYEQDIARRDRMSHMLDFTLSAMSLGGLFDHLAGGFFGLSNDGNWATPNFEKSLVDNAQLLAIYAERSVPTKSPWLAHVAGQTADWLLEEMQLDEGGFASNLDADLDGIEGAFYVWRPEDMGSYLGEREDAFASHYRQTSRSRADGRWHLRLADPTDSVIRDNPAQVMAGECAKLLAIRNERSRPRREDKVLTAANALTASGLIKAGRILEREELIAAGMSLKNWLGENHWRDGVLFASSSHGEVKTPGYLDDYVFLLDALICSLETLWQHDDLNFALTLAAAVTEHFEDAAHGGYFFTAAAHEPLLQRRKLNGDSALPSGNGTLARCLGELAWLTGQASHAERANAIMQGAASDIGRWPSAHGTLLRHALDGIAPPDRIVVRVQEPATAKLWRQALSSRTLTRTRCYVIPNSVGELPPGLESCQPLASDCAYLWHSNRGFGPALNSPDALAAALEEISRA